MWYTPEFKVGALVVVVASLIGAMSLKVAEGPGVLTGSRSHYFDVADAGGLVKNSAVKMAGIKVGVIDRIELVDGQARVFLKLEGDVPLTTASGVELRADGILGDRHVELVQGPVGAPPLESGTAIGKVQARGSLDNLVNEISKVTSSLSQVAQNLALATQGEGDINSPLGRIVRNIEHLTADLSEISGKNKDQLSDIISRVHSITTSLDDILNDDSHKGFKAAWNRLDNSLKNVEDITGKLNEGKGTIGRLINDDSTIDNLNSAVESVNNFLGAASQLETGIDFRSEYMTADASAKSFLMVRLQPGLDRYYEVGLVDDPKGVTEVTDTTIRSGNGETSDSTTRTFRNKIKFSALFAKNFHNLTLKGGLFENAGGMALDYYFLDRQLRFTTEIFNFKDLYVRAYARYNLLHGLYLIAGGDNLVDEHMSSGFIGGGLFLTNDDLKFFFNRINF